MATTAQLLQKYATFEHILLGDLRDLLEEPPDEHTPHWLLAVLDALLQTRPIEMELQAQDGYLSPVLEKYPSWSPQVDSLYRRHIELSEKLRLLRDRIGNKQPFAETARELRRDLRDWMLSVIGQHRSEAHLLQMAMTLDVGAGD